jgi:hypothetical protein
MCVYVLQKQYEPGGYFSCHSEGRGWAFVNVNIVEMQPYRLDGLSDERCAFERE